MFKFKEKIGIIGVGYIGLPMVAAFASVGYRVMGIDLDRRKMAKLRKTYQADIYEPGVNKTLVAYRKNIEFTVDNKKAMRECDIILVTVGTPLADDSRPNFKHIFNVTRSIGKCLRPGQLIVFKSTVVPGMTRQLASKLEKISRLKAGEDFDVVYCPERTVEGRALEELYNLPKIVGGINKKSLERGAKIIGRLGGKVLKVSSLEIAEMCKCVDNTYRVANIAFGNEIGNICEKIGIDGYELASAVNCTYPRTNLFLPGLGAGGPCLSKDPRILEYFARKKGVDISVISASIKRNKDSTERIIPRALSFINKNKIKRVKIALIGVAFKGKPETDDIRNSPAVEIYQGLMEKIKNRKVSFYDPLVKNFFEEESSESLKECLRDANVVMFLTNHPSFLGIDAREVLKSSSRPLLIVDCWHNLKNLEKAKGKDIQIFRVGDNNF